MPLIFLQDLVHQKMEAHVVILCLLILNFWFFNECVIKWK